MAMTWAEQDLESYIRDEEDYEARLPICDRCGEPITGDYEYAVGWDRLCEECAELAYIEQHGGDRKDIDYDEMDEWMEERKTTVELD